MVGRPRDRASFARRRGPPGRRAATPGHAGRKPQGSRGSQVGRAVGRLQGDEMSRLPTPEDLAKLVSYVFDVMLTLHCELVGRRPARDGETSRDRLQGLAWRTAVMPIEGSQPLSVSLSSDEQGCLALGAALFACAKTAV